MNTVLQPASAESMPKEQIRVLLVEDDEDDYILARTLVAAKENANLKLDWIDNYPDALLAIRRNEYDVYLVDFRLGENTGIDLIQASIDAGNHAPMILLTGQDDLSVDLSALELGAADYLVKGRIDAQLLGRSIRYALRQAQSLREIAEQEAKYRSLFERSMDAIFVIDHDGHLQDVNPAVEQLLGYDRDTLRRLSPLRLFGSPDEFRRLRFHVREYEQVKDFETTVVSQGGRRRSCLISIWAVSDSTGQARWYQGIVRDITEQKKAQQELIIAEKLSMTGKIARSIAHEVRNPLTNLSLSLDQLEEELPADNDSTQIYTDIIRRNVDRIGQLITEMLNSSKPRELDRRHQSLNDVVQDTLKLVTDRLKLKQMLLVTKFTDDECTALLDRDQIRTALVNILINAVEAMQPGEGVLTISTQCTDDDRAAVEIKDNGRGMDDDTRQRLFDPFFTGRQGGMGLGMTTTQNIVNGHRGSIEVESQLGVGTTFRITFPR